MKKYLNLIVLLISIVTVFSGITQLIVPRFVLGIVGAEITETSSHFFAIIGMFMTLFGGLMIQTIYSTDTGITVIVWSALQKISASIAVFVSIWKDIFALQAGAVAFFDLFSGVIFFIYLKHRLKSENS